MSVRHAAYVVVLIAALVAGCSKSPDGASGPAGTKVTVLVTPYLGYAPFYIAQEEGLFAEQGLDVEFVPGAGMAESLPLLLHGELDVYSGILTPGFMNAIARGGQARIVSDKGHIGGPGERYAGLVVRRDLVESGRLRGPADLQGLTFSSDPMASSRYMIDSVLAQGGLSIDDVRHTDVPAPLRAEAVAKGTIDAFTTSEPWLSRAEAGGDAVLWMAGGDFLPGFQTAFVAYGPRMLAQDTDVGNRFMVAYLKAVRRYNEGKTARNLDVLEKHLGLDRDLLVNASWPVIEADGRINARSLLDYEQWALERGWLDRIVTVDEFWDGRFIAYANAALAASGE